MVTDGQLLEKIIAEAQTLPPSDQLRLIQRVAEMLIPAIQPTPSQPLVYGQFRGKGMSTDEDFVIAEWRPTDRDLNGP